MFNMLELSIIYISQLKTITITIIANINQKLSSMCFHTLKSKNENKNCSNFNQIFLLNML